MYRVMLIDDEPLILAGIISMLNWGDYGCKIVGKATNGKQALNKINDLNPDIIITDIKMPAMDGIEFIQKAKEQGSEAIFILLTNLEEFKLVKKAMSLGAIDYLVKLELTEECLLKTINKAIEVCRNNNLRKSKNDTKFLESSVDEKTRNYFQKLLMYETDTMDIKDIPVYILERFKDPVIIMINFNYKYEIFSKDFNREEHKKIMSYAENILDEMVKVFFEQSCLISREQNSFILIVSTYEIDDYKKSIETMGQKMISVLKDYFEVSTSISVSEKDNMISRFIIMLNQAMSAMNYYYYYYYYSSNQIIFYSEKCEIYQKNRDEFSISFLKKDLYLAIHHNDSIKFQESMNKFINAFKDYKPSKVQAVNVCRNLYYLITSFYEDDDYFNFPCATNILDKLDKLGNVNNVFDWVIWFTNEVVEFINKKKIIKSDKIIEMIQQYVKEHCTEKISLSKVAYDVSISTGYLSSIFKKQTGMNFSDYVSEIKVEKAKELIGTHEYMMYEVSDILGFDNPYYFSKVFKKITGYTPKEYEVISLKNKIK